MPTMTALQMTAVHAPLLERRLAAPAPGPGEVAIEIRAAGICHSDVHYRAGAPAPREMPRTLGHEIAGDVAAVGEGVSGLTPGMRVAVNYVLHCGDCARCRNGQENHCPSVGMIGSSRDGGYAERVVVPARNALPIPDALPYAHAAVMMCSTATAYHALRLSAVVPGESVCIVGFGGLGASAVQLARALGAERIFAVERVPEKRALAETFGARGLDGSGDLSARLREATDGRGVDVVIDLVGKAALTQEILRGMARGGRLVAVALSRDPLTLDPYRDLIGPELHLMGSNDHLASELRELFGLAERGAFDLSRVVSRTVPLEAQAVNEVFAEIERGTPHLRTVIDPC